MKFSKMIVPCLALAALTAACEDKEDPTTVGTTTTANVRFINAVSGSGSMALTSNGSMVGSSQSFFNSATSGTPTCSTVNTSSTGNAFSFGTANTGGTGISGTATNFNQTLTSGGNYTVIATGSSSNPSFIFLNNTATSTAPTGFANVRFVNATGNNNFDAFATSGTSLTGSTASTTGLSSTNNQSGFVQVPTTNGTFTFTNNGSTTSVMQTTPFALSSGGNYTVVLIPGTTAGTYQTLVYNNACS